MNKMFIIVAVLILISSCENFTSKSSLSEQVSIDKIEFSEFTVNIKYKKDNSGNWTDLGTLIVRKEEGGIATGLNNDNEGGGHTATLFSLEESEVNNFVNAMTKGGAFNADYYYGYQEGEDYKSKNIETKIETINGSQFITFLGKNNSYAISLDELKNNLK
ncbi:Erp family outer-surface lipoprotein (plasmid) [Borreliella yangtzensis]|uniref:Erp family outer-surface lipoprotein n=1 Tax=Borreliella yangtzensis TaxID=683292 RepID=UPI003B21E32F